MSSLHIPEEELHEALALYRDALEDALSEFDVDADREEVIAEARRILGDDEPEALELIVAAADDDTEGAPVWQLEEELVDDRLDSDFDQHHPHLTGDGEGEDFDGDEY